MEQLLVALPVLILSVVLHEYAHGWMAYREGDPTAAQLGRLTLNPIPHIDLVGSIIVPAVLLLMPGGFIFGWAKPVPVNPRNFRNYKRGDILVSMAGIVVNFLLVFAFIILYVLATWAIRAMPELGSTLLIVRDMGVFGMLINLVLALFNLLPIPPLDGSHVMYHLLPPNVALRYRELGRYGMLILIGFLFLGGFRILIGPINFLFGAAMAFANSLV